VFRLKRAERLGMLTGLGTLVSSGALLWAVGADTVRLGVGVGIGLVLIAIVIGATVARPASFRLCEAVDSGDRAGAAAAGRQLIRVLGTASLLWIGALIGMVA
jgi:hypothetical protein